MKQTTADPDAPATDSSWLTPSRALGAAAVTFAVLGVMIAIARPASAPDDLSVLAAVVLGLVEGLTEYLPVSSTGHLLVTNELLGLGGTESSDEALDAYAIIIQAGAILAVVVLYWNRLTQMLAGLFGRDEEGRTVLIGALVAFTPAAVLGVLFDEWIEEQLFSPTTIAIAWFVGGLIVIWLSRTGRIRQAGQALSEITVRQALVIGFVQCLAMMPGTSRSLVTILAAVLVGLSLAAAVEFSFILGLGTLLGATVYKGAQSGELVIDTFGWGTPIIGIVVAFVSAVAAVRWMVGWLQQQGFEMFGWYRLVIGLLAFVAIGAGWL